MKTSMLFFKNKTMEKSAACRYVFQYGAESNRILLREKRQRHRGSMNNRTNR